jgi:predicted transcriptional regulator of viral defense system
MTDKDDKYRKEIAAFRLVGGNMTYTNATVNANISNRTLYEMRDNGIIEPISRGLYRLKDNPPMNHQDLVIVTLKVQKGVLCLISALSFYNLTTQIPSKIYVAIPRESHPPKLEYPPVTYFKFSGKAYSEGINTFKLDNVDIRIYCPEKTIADCFKYRNKIGMDITLESLKDAWKRKMIDLNKLNYFAKICRVENVMKPYLESML